MGSGKLWWDLFTVFQPKNVLIIPKKNMKQPLDAILIIILLLNYTIHKTL